MRHLLLFAVLVTVAGSASAVTVDEFVRNLPPDTIASSKRVKPYLNTSTGSKLALFRAANPWTTALTVGGLAASIVFEDELDQRLYDLFIGPDPIPNPEGTTGGYPSSWHQGYYWTNNTRTGAGVHYQTGDEACAAHVFSPATLGPSAGGNDYYCYWNGAPSGPNYVQRYDCDGLTSGVCGTPVETPLQWPADDISTGIISGGQITDYGPDVDVTAFSPSSQIFFHTPDGVMKINIDSNGSLTVQEFTPSPDPVTGVSGTKVEGIKVDPVSGTVLDKWEKYRPNLTPIEAIGGSTVEGTTPSVQVQFPDSMNVNVNEDGTPPPENPANSDYGGTGFDQLEAGFQVADPPSLNPLPDLPNYSASCQTITMTWKDNSLVFPSASQCAKLDSVKTLIGWFLYIITGWLIAMAVLDNRRAA